jgi:hypothetical protein
MGRGKRDEEKVGKKMKGRNGWTVKKKIASNEEN